MKNPPTLVEIRFPDHAKYFEFLEKEKRFVPLDESHLAKAIPGYTLLNEKARQKERDTFIKRSVVLQTFKVPNVLPNAYPDPCWDDLSPEKQADTIRAYLAIGEVFESPRAGYLLIADQLCGLHCQSLRKAEPGFHPTVAIRSDSSEVCATLKQITRSAIPAQRWYGKGSKIRRKRCLDYRTKLGASPHHVQDFTQCKCTIDDKHRQKYVDEYGGECKCRTLKFPLRYTNSIALIIGANAPQIREAAPYIEDTAVVFLNSDSGDFRPTKLSAADCAAYDPEIVNQLKEYRKQIGMLLCWWWIPHKREDAWAAQIVQEARASFGKPDSRYVSVELDPKLLRDRIRYLVFLRFLDELESYGYMSHEDLDPYRQAAKEVFDPVPPEPVVIRRAEDPAVFIEIMQALSVEMADSIIAEGAKFVKADKPFGAWRTISSKRYLVMLESTWAKEYAKAVRKRKEIDPSFFKQDRWEREMQKSLVEAKFIKEASSGYRYRYNLLGNGTRNSTYVVAIPAERLDT